MHISEFDSKDLTMNFAVFVKSTRFYFTSKFLFHAMLQPLQFIVK